MATVETSLEANYGRRTHGRTKRLIGARATALPKKEHSLFTRAHKSTNTRSTPKELLIDLQCCNLMDYGNKVLLMVLNQHLVHKFVVFVFYHLLYINKMSDVRCLKESH